MDADIDCSLCKDEHWAAVAAEAQRLDQDGLDQEEDAVPQAGDRRNDQDSRHSFQGPAI